MAQEESQTTAAGRKPLDYERARQLANILAPADGYTMSPELRAAALIELITGIAEIDDAAATSAGDDRDTIAEAVVSTAYANTEECRHATNAYAERVRAGGYELALAGEIRANTEGGA